MVWDREQIAKKAAALVEDGDVINLGIGIPTLVANHLGDRDVMLHSENGLLGMGPFPLEGEEDPQLINAGKQTVTVVPGGSTFDSALSFAMIRGGHVDVAMLGAMEVAHNGDLANWQVPGEKVTGMGGAMDLVSGARRVVCLMTHTDKSGAPKLVERCTLPLTGLGCVDVVITDLGVFAVDKAAGCFRVVELAEGITLDEAKHKSGARLEA
ncbi:MAG: succinyl-CoA--3-ketoacid-CoA transferase [Deltaproteobacteria bacterium RBG_16_71_12]|nr:MAG: succinyl-CoA--3-ketoacid-CoA transferase [Deltaproteobacteria bacterium RBG_16_71_12]